MKNERDARQAARRDARPTNTYGQPAQPAPDVEGSTFAQPARLMPPLVSPAGDVCVTPPDVDGCCRFTFSDKANAALGNPVDAVQLYGWDGIIEIFPDLPLDVIEKLQANAHPRNHPGGAPIWQGYRLDEKLPNGNYDQSGKRISPNAMYVIAGTTLEQFKLLIASQKRENYYKTPYSQAGGTTAQG